MRLDPLREPAPPLAEVEVAILDQLQDAWRTAGSGGWGWADADAYVQWAKFGPGMQIECGHKRAREGLTFSFHERRQLQMLGFQEPDGTIPNHWQRHEDHAELEGAARALARCLLEVIRPGASDATAPEPAPHPLAAFGELVALFQDADLALPPVPAKLRARLSRWADWVYATERVDSTELYLFHGAAVELLTRQPYPRLAVCHAGHGINSYALTYQLVTDRLVILAQEGWGGVLMDAGQARADVNTMFRHLEDIQSICEDVANWPQGLRLVLLHSSLRGIGAVGWLTGPVPRALASSWIQLHRIDPAQDDALRQARDLLMDLEFPPGPAPSQCKYSVAVSSHSQRPVFAVIANDREALVIRPSGHRHEEQCERLRRWGVRPPRGKQPPRCADDWFALAQFNMSMTVLQPPKEAESLEEGTAAALLAMAEWSRPTPDPQPRSRDHPTPARQVAVLDHWAQLYPAAADGAEDPEADLALALLMAGTVDPTTPHRWLPPTLAASACAFCAELEDHPIHAREV